DPAVPRPLGARLAQLVHDGRDGEGHDRHLDQPREPAPLLPHPGTSRVSVRPDEQRRPSSTSMPAPARPSSGGVATTSWGTGKGSAQGASQTTVEGRVRWLPVKQVSTT